MGVGADGSPSYTFYGEGGADRMVEPSELPVLPESVAGLQFGSYSIVARPIADALAELAAREHGRRFISLDPNVRLGVVPDAAVWRDRVDTMAGTADLVKISLEDIETLYPEAEPETLAARWLQRGAQMVVITRGGGGVLALTDRLRLEAPSARVEIVDTVGAGDTFQAALLAGLAELGFARPRMLETIDEATLSRALAFATQAAAVTCSRRGADLPRREELGAL